MQLLLIWTIIGMSSGAAWLCLALGYSLWLAIVAYAVTVVFLALAGLAAAALCQVLARSPVVVRLHGPAAAIPQ